MRAPVVSVVMALGAAAVPAQTPAAEGDDLPRLRATFAPMAHNARVVAIPVARTREPVILTGGTDAGGQPLSPRSLLPLQALAKVLAADAIHVQCKGKVDQGSGVVVGGCEFA